MVKINIIKDIVCTNSIQCNDGLRLKLETPALKLHADNENDTVHGSISILHTPNAHRITVEIYENNENANEKHSSTLKRPVTIPTKKQVEALLE